MGDVEVKYSKKCMWVKLSTWNKIMFVIKLSVFALMVGSLCTSRWVEQGSNETYWSGGLLRCGGCDGDFEGLFYHSILQISNDNNLHGFSKTFGSLTDAGIVYTVFETIGLLCIGAILLSDLHCLEKIRGRIIMNLLYVGLILSHSICMFSWFFITDAMFFNECRRASGYKQQERMCPTDGPVLSVCCEVVIVGLSLLAVVIPKDFIEEISPMPSAKSIYSDVEMTSMR